MNNQIISIQAESIALLGPNRNVFKNGASVFVKILSDNGNGTYEGSVAGNRVTISSLKELAVGSSFIANISGKNGTVYITPKDSIKNSILNSSIEISVLQNSQLSQILGDLCVPVNALSENLLKMMMQLEMKIDGDFLRNIYKLALKYKGNEKAAGEILLILEEKGINATQEDIQQLIYFLRSNFSNGEAGGDSHSYVNARNRGGKNLINKINSKNGGWFLLPYNLVIINNNNIIASGIIKILIGKSNRLKLVNLNCFFDNKEYLFSIGFRNKVCDNIRFYIESAEKTPLYYEQQLKLLINNDRINIKWCNRELIEGFGSQGEEVHSFCGEA